VELESVPPDLPDTIGELPFVLSAEARADTLVVRVSREGDFRKALSERLIRLNLVPLRISEKVPSLEDAFMTITQENIALLAEGGRQ
jgi:ABC-2 type transport system ATP-binding protein